MVVLGSASEENSRTMEREVVVVTGASAGVSRAVAQEFARHHARDALLAAASVRIALE
jgi:NAD(P)-dependent dehydrogenase (short-subunit alcohol dehydrogenase family)